MQYNDFFNKLSQNWNAEIVDQLQQFLKEASSLGYTYEMGKGQTYMNLLFNLPVLGKPKKKFSIFQISESGNIETYTHWLPRQLKGSGLSYLMGMRIMREMTQALQPRMPKNARPRKSATGSPASLFLGTIRDLEQNWEALLEYLESARTEIATASRV